jgi:hypothetical protein
MWCVELAGTRFGKSTSCGSDSQPNHFFENGLQFCSQLEHDDFLFLFVQPNSVTDKRYHHA